MNNLANRIAKLEAVLGRGNFSTSTVQQRDATYNGRLRLVNRTALPSKCATGELAVLGGVEYICSAPNTWSKVGAQVFGGQVVSNAAGSFFPSGWSLTHVGTGIYKITHNLGVANTAYSFVAFPTFTGEAQVISGYNPIDTNNIEVYITAPDATFTLKDSDFYFILTK